MSSSLLYGARRPEMVFGLTFVLSLPVLLFICQEARLSLSFLVWEVRVLEKRRLRTRSESGDQGARSFTRWGKDLVTWATGSTRPRRLGSPRFVGALRATVCVRRFRTHNRTLCSVSSQDRRSASSTTSCSNELLALVTSRGHALPRSHCLAVLTT